MRALAFICFLGCQSAAPVMGPVDLLPPPRGAVRLIITASATLAQVDRVAITVTNPTVSKMYLLATAGSIPPNRVFDISVDYGGATTFKVVALDSAGQPLGEGSAMVDVGVDQAVDLIVTLQPT